MVAGTPVARPVAASHGAEARVENLNRSTGGARRNGHGVEVALVSVRSRSRRGGGIHDVVGSRVYVPTARGGSTVVLRRIGVPVLLIASGGTNRTPCAEAPQRRAACRAGRGHATVGVARAGRRTGWRRGLALKLEAADAHVRQRAAHRHRHDVCGPGLASDGPVVDTEEPDEEGGDRRGDLHVQLASVAGRVIRGDGGVGPVDVAIRVGDLERCARRAGRGAVEIAGQVHDAGHGGGVGRSLDLETVAPGVRNVDGDAHEPDEGGQHEREQHDDLTRLFGAQIDPVSPGADADAKLRQAHWVGGSSAITVESVMVILPLLNAATRPPSGVMKL